MKLSFFKCLFLACAIFNIFACQSIKPGNMDPAIISDKPQNIQRLTQHISSILQADVLLAPDIFSKSNQLIIEQRPHQPIQHPSRILDAPYTHVFYLYILKKNCYLFYQNNNQTNKVNKLQCHKLEY